MYIVSSHELCHERAPPGDSARCTVSTPRGAYGESSRQHRATSQQHKAPGYLLAIECQQRQLLDARPRGEREVVSLKILDAKEDLQRDNLALAS